MAKELIFKLQGADFAAEPVKLERKKLYGWTETVATDRSGGECNTAYLSPYDALIIPAGGLSQGTVDASGRWVEKKTLTAYDENGVDVLPILPSSFDSPIELTVKVSIDEFLDNDWESVYQIKNESLLAALGNDIYKFDFSFRGGVNHNFGYLVATPAGLFLFAGDAQPFQMVGLAEETIIDEADDTPEESIDELDFSMF